MSPGVISWRTSGSWGQILGKLRAWYQLLERLYFFSREVYILYSTIKFLSWSGSEGEKNWAVLFMCASRQALLSVLVCVSGLVCSVCAPVGKHVQPAYWLYLGTGNHSILPVTQLGWGNSPGAESPHRLLLWWARKEIPPGFQHCLSLPPLMGGRNS